MKITFSLGICICIILIYFNGLGQVNAPQVIPPSPTAAAFHIYGDYPVGYNTGLADISIPIFTIEVGNIKVPITLRYHHAGVKFYETEQSNVATGWIIDYGGLISVTHLGKTDRYAPYAYKSVNNPDQGKATFDSLQNICNNLHSSFELDGQYDIYTYNINGRSGKFIYTKNNQVIKFPYNSIDFKLDWPINLDKIDTYDEEGTHFRFGKSIDEGIYAIEGSGFGSSSWLLTDIELLSGDKIKYNYKESDGGYKLFPNHYAKVTDWRQGHPFARPLPPNPGYDKQLVPEGECLIAAGSSEISYSTKIIQEINFPNGKIVFNSEASGGLRISQIGIYNNAGLIKIIKFNTTDFDGMQKRYALNSVEFIDCTTNVESKYKFNYNPTRFPLADNTNALDYWGYYNGKTSNTSLVPNFNITMLDWDQHPTHIQYNRDIYSDGHTCNREPDNSLMQAYILNKITYPTGGTTDFIYQANRYGPDNKLGGGLRIYKIINNDGLGHTSTKTYEYGQGYLNLDPGDPNNYLDEYKVYHLDLGPAENSHSHRIRIYHADMSPRISLGGNQVTYQSVIEYNGTETDNTGRTTYRFNNHANMRTGFETDLCFIQYLSIYDNWEPNQLTDKIIEKLSAPGVYDTIQKIHYEYTFNERETITGTVVSKIWEVPDSYFCLQSGGIVLPLNNSWVDYESWNYLNLVNCSTPLGGTLFKFFNYTIKTGVETLIYTTDNLKTNNGYITKREDYGYDNPDYLQPTRVNTSTSNGYNIEKRNKYILSPEYIGTSPYDQMKQKNILSPVLEEKTYKLAANGETLLSTSKTGYKQFYPTIFQPEVIQTSIGSNAPENRITFNSYDNKGNILSVSKDGGPKKSYIWSYNQSYPTAEVLNADNNQIAYTSFETTKDDMGGWQMVGTDFGTTVGAKTGNKYLFSLNPGIKKSGLDTQKNYQVQFWYKWDDIYINSTKVADINSEDQTWRFYSGMISPNQNGDIIISGPGNIDELRLCPSDAQMTTYTYKPLIGMTSSTDPNGKTTYYEYDTFGRLSLVKDNDGKIIKKYDYHYANQ